MFNFQLNDDKRSSFSESKGTVAMFQDKRNERHTLTVNGRTYYYSGEVGLAALMDDFEKLKDLDFAEQ